MNHYLSNIGPIQRNVFWGTFMIMNEVLTICLLNNMENYTTLALLVRDLVTVKYLYIFKKTTTGKPCFNEYKEGEKNKENVDMHVHL